VIFPLGRFFDFVVKLTLLPSAVTKDTLRPLEGDFRRFARRFPVRFFLPLAFFRFDFRFFGFARFPINPVPPLTPKASAACSATATAAAAPTAPAAILVNVDLPLMNSDILLMECATAGCFFSCAARTAPPPDAAALEIVSGSTLDLDMLRGEALIVPLRVTPVPGTL